MTIEEYAEAILPLIRQSYKDGNRKSHLWYLYRQAFYGFSEFMDRNTKCRVSAHADLEFHRSNPDRDLRKMTWVDQPAFDKGRKKFILEHIYTGEMFRNAVKELYEQDKLTIGNLVALVRDNYCVAWILKEENRKLPKSVRGTTLQDALSAYKEKDVHLLPN